jgi:hypothetical protein
MAKSKLYYWLPVFVLLGMCLVLGVVTMLAAPRVLDVVTGISLTGSNYMAKQNEALSKLGILVYGSGITTTSEEKVQLDLTIGDTLQDGIPIDPYNLISGTHKVIYIALTSPDLDPPEVDLVLIRVVDSQGAFLYSVLLDLQYFEAVLDEEITEQDYLNSWIVSENAPEFKIRYTW